MTRLHLLGLSKVRRSLILPVVLFTIFNAAIHLHEFDGRWFWMVPAYVLFDSSLWIGAAFLVFAVIERRQTLPRQSRLAAMAAATAGISALASAMITLRALFESIVQQRSFAASFLAYMPGDFFKATFFIAIVTGIGYAVYSWAVDEHRLAEAAELDAAIARAELKAAASRLQPELLSVTLSRIATRMSTNAPAGQRLIADLGELLHYSLAHPPSQLVPLGEELDFVERYLDFQRAVLAGPVRVSIAADAQARSRQVPNLTVLSLVQEAIARSAQNRIELSIAATAAEDIVKITVTERVLRDSPFDQRPAPDRGGERRFEIELPAA